MSMKEIDDNSFDNATEALTAEATEKEPEQTAGNEIDTSELSDFQKSSDAEAFDDTDHIEDPENASEATAESDADEEDTAADVEASAPSVESDSTGEQADEGNNAMVEAEGLDTVFVSEDEPVGDDEPEQSENINGKQPEEDSEYGNASHIAIADNEAYKEKTIFDEYEDSEEEAATEETHEKSGRTIDSVFDFVELFIFSLVAVLIFTTFFFRHSVVEGGSMEGTLYEDEHLIISDLFYSPERGDIIVCEDYSTSLRKPIVKRVIGLPGDRVQVFEDVVLINGERLNEDYVLIDGPLYEYNIDLIVPEGEIFVMGDHRNSSTDSRDFGTVSTDSIIGKVLFRFYPFDKFGVIKQAEY